MPDRCTVRVAPAEYRGDELAIATAGLGKRFGQAVAVDDLHLRVRRGEIYGFLGANGAGKTTTILMLLGIVTPDHGTIRLLGRELSRESLQLKRQIGVICESQYLYPDMTCAQYLGFFAELYEVGQPARRIGGLLETLGLGAQAGSIAASLSRGLQQKLGLARALLHDPPLLILDEPVSGLDPLGIRVVRELLLQERSRGKTVLMSSHLLSEVERVADRVGILVGGRLLAEGQIPELRRRYSAPSLEEVFVTMHAGPAASAPADAAGRPERG